jgi:hypothetical protein
MRGFALEPFLAQRCPRRRDVRLHQPGLIRRDQADRRALLVALHDPDALHRHVSEEVGAVRREDDLGVSGRLLDVFEEEREHPYVQGGDPPRTPFDRGAVIPRSIWVHFDRETGNDRCS